jgi:putative pyruvate formate lyase activating enzyme
MIIRHLVLPNDIAGSKQSLGWVASTLGAHTTLSVMSQYFPTHAAVTMPLLDRKIREGEYHRVLASLERLGLDRGWIQDFEASEYYKPEFDDRERPFKGESDNRI